MDIFTFDDLEAAFVRAVDLHRHLLALSWLGVSDPAEYIEGEQTLGDLQEDAAWARQWAIQVAFSYGRVHKQSPVALLNDLRSRYLPEGWTDIGAEDEVEDF